MSCQCTKSPPIVEINPLARQLQLSTSRGDECVDDTGACACACADEFAGDLLGSTLLFVVAWPLDAGDGKMSTLPKSSIAEAASDRGSGLEDTTFLFLKGIAEVPLEVLTGIGCSTIAHLMDSLVMDRLMGD